VQPTEMGIDTDLAAGIVARLQEMFARGEVNVPPENIRLLRHRIMPARYLLEEIAFESATLVFVDGVPKLNPHIALFKAVRMNNDTKWIIDQYTVRVAKGLAVARAGLFQPERVVAYGIFTALPGVRTAQLKIETGRTIDRDELIGGAGILLAALGPESGRAQVELLDQGGKEVSTYQLPIGK
jgi:hypothetical protein